MMVSTYQKQTAVVASAPGQLVVSNQVEIPKIEPNKVLVKTTAVALNPVDAKMVDMSCTVGAIAGFDFVGVVVGVGDMAKESKEVVVRDRVCGFVHGMNARSPNLGSFAEYVAADGDILIKVPDWMSDEAAATLGVGVATAGLALYQSLGIGGHPNSPVNKPSFVLVYGASTATGTIAIQLLKLSGFRPIAVCSAINFDLVKSLGAEMVFDYHDSTWSQDVRANTKNSIRYALDCIGEPETMRDCYKAIGRAGGKYTSLEPFSTEEAAVRPTVTPGWVMSPEVFGEEIIMDGDYGRLANPKLREFGKQWFQDVERLVHERKLQPHPYKSSSQGWDGIIEGVNLLRLRKVSGQKLVFTIP